MNWIISHKSALEFWRSIKAEDALKMKKLRTMKLQEEPPTAKKIIEVCLRGFSVPLHILVGGSGARRTIKNLHCHVSSGEFQSGSFIRIDSGLIVCSPELCFIQMATELGFIDLVVLGYELCGSYSLRQKDDSDHGFRTDIPLTCVRSISSYIEKMTGLNGVKNAKKALRFIADGSASPMETVLAMLLVLPYRLGGFYFPKPKLNYRIDVPVSVRKTSGNSKYYCDLYWPEVQVDVEYDSDSFHTGTDRIEKDAIRRNSLTGMGITVVTVSRKQIMETSKMFAVAEILSKLLGKRLQYNVKEHKRLQSKLLHKLITLSSI